MSDREQNDEPVFTQAQIKKIIEFVTQQLVVRATQIQKAEECICILMEVVREIQ